MPLCGLDRFIRDEDGAVTADWVVLCGLAVGVSIAVYTALGDGVADHSERVGDEMVKRGIPTYGLTETHEN